MEWRRGVGGERWIEGLAQREWSADQAGRFRHWSKVLWGMPAPDRVRGYMAWGGPGLDLVKIDGTLVPCAGRIVAVCAGGMLGGVARNEAGGW